jgi:hypothetical protein
MLAAAAGIRPMPPENAEDAKTGWAAVREGFAFLKGRRVLQSTFAIDIVAMVFGMPRALFPILALSQFHRGEGVVGLLFAAPAVGALMGALTTGWVKHVRQQGRAVIWAVIVWGAGITAFGLVATNLWLGLFFLAVAGAADVDLCRVPPTIPVAALDSMRGRLSGSHLVVTGGQLPADARPGLVAQAFSPCASVVSGGLLCIAGAGLVLAHPELRRYPPASPADTAREPWHLRDGARPPRRAPGPGRPEPVRPSPAVRLTLDVGGWLRVPRRMAAAIERRVRAAAGAAGFGAAAPDGRRGWPHARDGSPGERRPAGSRSRPGPRPTRSSSRSRGAPRLGRGPQAQAAACSRTSAAVARSGA